MKPLPALAALAALLLVACVGTPTPDVEATVQTRVAATQAAQATAQAAASATQAAQPTTIATLTPQPTVTQTPSPSPIPSPTPTLKPTPTRPPTATPTRTPIPTDTPEPTDAPTVAPPTDAPAPTQPPQDTRGLVVNAYWVEGAPGPFGVGQDIWFNFDLTNGTDQILYYDALGAWVEQTGQFQKSYFHSSFDPGSRLAWDDHINIPEPGTYSLWLAVQFDDGMGAKLSGPVVVTVE